MDWIVKLLNLSVLRLKPKPTILFGNSGRDYRAIQTVCLLTQLLFPLSCSNRFHRRFLSTLTAFKIATLKIWLSCWAMIVLISFTWHDFESSVTLGGTFQLLYRNPIATNLWKNRLSPYCHYKYSSNTTICCIRTLRRSCSRQTRVIWYSPSTSLCQVTWKRFFIFTFLHSAANWCNIYSETVEAKSSTLELFGKKKFVETTCCVFDLKMKHRGQVKDWR